jgi:hypothetical protein
MGTITRSFANNITTSGVLLPASLTNASIANVTAYNASVATGGMVLVSSATASASANIEFSLGSYKEYQFFFIDIHASVDGAYLNFNFSTDNGSNYNVTKTSTYFGAYHFENDLGHDLVYRADQDLAQGTGFQNLTRNIGNDNDENASAILNIFNPSSTTYVKHFLGTTSETNRDIAILNNFVAGYANTTSALTNIKFQMDTGNIDDGTILMYGIV